MRPLNLLLLWFAEKRTRAHFLLTAAVNYTHFVIRDTLLNGIADSEIRREILRTANILTTAVNVIALVENKEMTWNAIPSTYVSAMSEFKQVKNSAPGKDHQTSVRKQFTSAPTIIPHDSHVLAARSSLACIKKVPGVGTLDPILCALTASVNAAAINVKQQVHFLHQPQFTLLPSRTRALRN